MAVLLLNACSWLQTEPPLPSAQAQEAQRLALTDWTVKARLASDEHRASLRWRQQGEDYDLVLRGPFGLGGLRIVGDPGQAQINDGKETLETAEPALEIYRRTGLAVPLSALPYWMRGVPAPGLPARTQRGAAGHLRLIEQAGWRVELADYAAPAGISFPYWLRLSQESRSLLVEVREWQAGP